jgi:hypothetical protein
LIFHHSGDVLHPVATTNIYQPRNVMAAYMPGLVQEQAWSFSIHNKPFECAVLQAALALVVPQPLVTA